MNSVQRGKDGRGSFRDHPPVSPYGVFRSHGSKLLVALLLTLTTACIDTASPTTKAEPVSTTTTQRGTTTTTPAGTSTTGVPPLAATEIVLELPPVTQLSGMWELRFFVPYGDGPDQLGTSRGGSVSGQIEFGPEYGAQAADGSWWFVDVAKFRLAHFSEDGTYLEEVPIPPEYLNQGQYFPYELLHILDDGALVLAWQGFDVTRLLVYDGNLTLVPVEGLFNPIYGDGVSIYGFTETGELRRVDPLSGSSEIVDWFSTRSGTRFSVFARDDEWLIELPDTPAPKSISIRTVYSEDPSQPVIAVPEHATGEDGSLFVLLYGTTFEGDSPQLGGFFVIDGNGGMTPIEPIRDPFSESDPGSPAHLGVRPGTSTPWLVFVDVDGVRVFTRTVGAG